MRARARSAASLRRQWSVVRDVTRQRKAAPLSNPDDLVASAAAAAVAPGRANNQMGVVNGSFDAQQNSSRSWDQRWLSPYEFVTVGHGGASDTDNDAVFLHRILGKTPLSWTRLTSGQTAAEASTITASISPAANALILVVLHLREPVGSGDSSVSGCNLNWVECGQSIWDASSANAEGYLAIFRAQASNPTTGALTITHPFTANVVAYEVFEVTGHVADRPPSEGYDWIEHSVRGMVPLGFTGAYRFDLLSGLPPDEIPIDTSDNFDVNQNISYGEPPLTPGFASSCGFNGTDSRFGLTGNGNNDNIFVGGGTCAIIARVDAATATSTLFRKGDRWHLRASGESGGNYRVTWLRDWDTSDGQWQTAVDLPIGVPTVFVVTYNESSATADPTIVVGYLDSNGDPNISVRTVGNGLTEISTPSGSAVTDPSLGINLGSRFTDTEPLDGALQSFGYAKQVELTPDQAVELVMEALGLSNGRDAVYNERSVNTSLTQVASIGDVDAIEPGDWWDVRFGAAWFNYQDNRDRSVHGRGLTRVIGNKPYSVASDVGGLWTFWREGQPDGEISYGIPATDGAGWDHLQYALCIRADKSQLAAATRPPTPLNRAWATTDVGVGYVRQFAGADIATRAQVPNVSGLSRQINVYGDERTYARPLGRTKAARRATFEDYCINTVGNCVGLWYLDERYGVFADRSGNGNDGVMEGATANTRFAGGSAASGGGYYRAVPGLTHLGESVRFHPDTHARINCGNPSTLNNIWNGGGTLVFAIRVDLSSGGGQIVTKLNSGSSGGWNLSWSDTGGLVQLELTHFGTTVGQWQTGTDISQGQLIVGAFVYDASTDYANNDPILYLLEEDYRTLTTAGGGRFQLSENQTPSGTKADDAAHSWIIGNAPTGGAANSMDGVVGPIIAFNAALTAAEIRGVIYRLMGLEDRIHLTTVEDNGTFGEGCYYGFYDVRSAQQMGIVNFSSFGAISNTNAEHRAPIVRLPGGRLVVAMHVVQTTPADIRQLWYSDDGGLSWTQASTNPWEGTTEQDQLVLFPADTDDPLDVCGIYWDANGGAGTLGELSVKMLDWSAATPYTATETAIAEVEFASTTTERLVACQDPRRKTIWVAAMTEHDAATADARLWRIQPNSIGSPDITDMGIIPGWENIGETDGGSIRLVYAEGEQAIYATIVTGDPEGGTLGTAQALYAKRLTGLWGSTVTVDASFQPSAAGRRMLGAALDDFRGVSHTPVIRAAAGGRVMPQSVNNDTGNVWANFTQSEPVARSASLPDAAVRRRFASLRRH